MHSPQVTFWCSISTSFILGPFLRALFEILQENLCSHCRKEYNTFARNVVPAFKERNLFHVVLLVCAGHEVKAFLLDNFIEEGLIYRGCKFEWPPTISRFYLNKFLVMGILKLSCILGLPSHFSGTVRCHGIDAMPVGGIDAYILHSALTSVITHFTCLISGDGGHVENLLLPQNKRTVSCFCCLFHGRFVLWNHCLSYIEIKIPKFIWSYSCKPNFFSEYYFFYYRF